MNSIASTSASYSIQKSFTYDVFLSFMDEDTGKNFADHLDHALQQRGIKTYKDNETIKKRGRISDETIRSIEDSKFHVVVFSKNYASSPWCLDELVKIMECQSTTKQQTAYPVFYDVEPAEVRNQSGAVGEAFTKHLLKCNHSPQPKWERIGAIVASCCNGSSSSLSGFISLAELEKDEDEDVGRWRYALRTATSQIGWQLRNSFHGNEVKFIQHIVRYISLTPRFTKATFQHSFRDSSQENLVGMETRVMSVVSSVEINSDDVRMIGIWGMGGGGKTTLARAVFRYLCSRFEYISFVENVRERVSSSGLRELQNQVAKDVLNDDGIYVTSVSEGKGMMRRIMSHKKVLLVLDDVDDIGQLEALAGEPSWFKSGSKIIITTRDKEVLSAHGVNFIHDVSLLSYEEAVCLFSRYAFRREVPIQGYEDLSGKVVHYAGGLPLTIKVLGSYLCGRTVQESLDAIKRLKTTPLKETLESLELTYNSLQNNQKEIFLDVSCILKGERKDEAIRILESYGFRADLILRALEQKSLISISNTDTLHLHDHVEEMGRYIVRGLQPDEPSRHNRLWIKEEIEDILFNELGTKATRSIKLHNTNLHPAIIMKGLRKMKELRFLYVDGGYRESKVDEDIQYLPDTLRSLCWSNCPLWCLPKTFRANNLVNLVMKGSSISQLWEGGERKVLNKLRFLGLMSSKLRTFDLGLTPHLERLDLRGSNKFVELLMPFECPKLKFLDLSGSRLTNLNLGLTPHLESLDLRGCNDFVELLMPFKCPKLKSLNLSGSRLSNLNVGLTPNLEVLYLECSDFVELNIPVEGAYLKFFNLCGSKVSNLNIGLTQLLEKLGSLEKLRFSIKDIQHLPDSIFMLKHLKSLKLESCWLLERLPKDLDKLEGLEELDLTDCISLLDIPNSICMMKCLKYLYLPHCILVKKLPLELGSLECLKELNIEGTCITHLPPSIFQLKGLCIVWSRGRLELCGFRSLKEISRYTASCYV